MLLKKVVFICLAIIPYIGLCLDKERTNITNIMDLGGLLFNVIIGYPFIAYCITESVWYFMRWLE